ncbi:unnamed protein product [Ixodes hexagonus]
MCVSKLFTLVAALCIVAVHSEDSPSSLPEDNTRKNADLPAPAASNLEGPVNPKSAPDPHANSVHDSDVKVQKNETVKKKPYVIPVKSKKADVAVPDLSQSAPKAVAPQVPVQASQDKASEGARPEAPPPNIDPVHQTPQHQTPQHQTPQPEKTVQKPPGAVAPPEGPPKDDRVLSVGVSQAAAADTNRVVQTLSKEPQPQAPDQAKASIKQDTPKPETLSTKIQAGPSTTTKTTHSGNSALNPSARKTVMPQVDDKGDLPNEMPSNNDLAGTKNPPQQPKVETTEQKEALRPPSDDAVKPDTAQIAVKVPAEKPPTNDKPNAVEPPELAKEAPAVDEEPRPELPSGQGSPDDDFSPSGFEQPSGGLDGGGGSAGERPEKPLDVSVVSPLGDGARFSGIPVEDDSHFFAYFLTAVVFCVLGYLAFHNKRKILALIVEGRHERLRRNNAAYRRLDNTDEDLGVRKGRGSF